MIQQVTLENLYNFKHEVVFDFTNSGNDGGLYYAYPHANVSNLSILYGKNNVGKSNFLRVLNEVKAFVLDNVCHLSAYIPSEVDRPSRFEIVMQVDDYEIYYGFILDLNEKRILDEYMESIDETGTSVLLFSRSEKIRHTSLQAYAFSDDVLYLHTLSKVDVCDVVGCALVQFDKIMSHSFAEKSDADLSEKLAYYKNETHYLEIINAILRAADLEIVEINIADQNIHYVHRSGASFPYALLSSGTKQLLLVVIEILDCMHVGGVGIYDEIETGLHFDLVDLILNIIKVVIEKEPKVQFVISTHREALLDYDFISNENKAFMKLENDTITVDYLSNYHLNPDHLPSKRYQLNAFETNPNTAGLYEAIMLILNGDIDASS